MEVELIDADSLKYNLLHLIQKLELMKQQYAVVVCVLLQPWRSATESQVLPEGVLIEKAEVVEV